MNEYLEHSQYIDWDNHDIKELASQLAAGNDGELAIAKACFEFVRDHIKHSWDYKQNPVTIKASDVLQHGTGYCYAKSHLLAALLRANGIPTALCYQKLTITDKPPFCIHGLNAIFLNGFGWYRVDARGNKEGVNAQLTPPLEQLAFNLIHPDERDVPDLFASPHQAVVSLLESSESIEEVYSRLVESDFTGHSQ